MEDRLCEEPEMPYTEGSSLDMCRFVNPTADSRPRQKLVNDKNEGPHENPLRLREINSERFFSLAKA